MFTWTSPDEREKEYNGIVILAIALARAKPHYKADMFEELTKIKGITLKQFGNNVLQLFDAVKKGKQRMNQKDKIFI